MSVSYVNVVIDQMINLYLTFRKKAYCEIREILKGAETSASNGISVS